MWVRQELEIVRLWECKSDNLDDAIEEIKTAQATKAEEDVVDDEYYDCDEDEEGNTI